MGYHRQVPIQIDRRYTGELEDEGVIPLHFSGDVSHYKGTGKPQEWDYVFVGDLDQMTSDVVIAGTATVQVEGNLSDPSDNDRWFNLEEFTSSGQLAKELHVPWLRYRISSHSSGLVTVHFSGRA